MQSPRVLIVSGADEKFFPLLEGLVLSLRAQEQGESVSIGFFDLGLSEAQRAALTHIGEKIVTPEWDVRVPKSAENQPHLRALTARFLSTEILPRLRHLFVDGR